MPEGSALDIVMSDSVRDAIETHCFSRLDVEVGGFLLGTIDGNSVRIVGAKAALTATSEQTHLTFTHEAWAEILDVMDTEFPGLAIVGWYHSHPGFGCFLSDYDIFIQENFFSAQGQHALVIDPIEGTYAFFTASAGLAKEVRGGRTIREAIGGIRRDKMDVIAAQAEVNGRNRRGGRRVVPVLVGILATAVIVGAAGWFIGSIQGRETERVTAQQKEQIAKDREASLLADLQVAQQVPASPAPQPSTAPGPAESTAPAQGLVPGDSAVFLTSYEVRGGDSWWGLAGRFLGAGIRYRELIDANPTVAAGGLVRGQVIVIPLTGTVLGTLQGDQ